jgi:hypothetical protein
LRVSNTGIITSSAPTTAIPSSAPSPQPTLAPTVTPSTILPTLAPSQAFITTTFNPTAATGLSSINSASNSQTGVSNVSIGVVAGCIIVAIIVIGACIFVARNSSKEKMSPYQIWTTHYSNREKQLETQNQNVVNHSPINMKEDIHHFYNKSPRPSINQNTVFTPHVSGRISSRNSQIVSPMGSQRNMQRLSITRGPSLHNNI